MVADHSVPLLFYAKIADKRALLLKEKYDRLSGGGGSGSGPAGAEKASGVGDRKALRKALERRRKKNTQKERKDMPLGASEGAVPKRMRAAGSSATGGSPGGKPRDTAGSEAPRPRKRGKRGGS